MNYRHVYHAGNFADVLKHTVLTLVLTYMKRKPAPFRVIDTHAGIGVYDLESEQANKTGEWRHGIGRMQASKLAAPLTELLQPYFSCLEAINAPGTLTRYPGSPFISALQLRQQDRLIANELHVEDCRTLGRNLSRFANAKVLGLDGWVSIKALLPPKEGRAVIMIDPPFEEPGEFERLTSAAKLIQKRFRSGTVMLWYPIKDLQKVAHFQRQLAADIAAEILCAELVVRAPQADQPVSATGLAIINPTFLLERQLSQLLPVFVEHMGCGRGATHRLFWLNKSC